MSAATTTTFPVRPNRFPKPYPVHYPSAYYIRPTNNTLRSSISARNLGGLVAPRPARLLPSAKAVSRADDSAPSGKSVENALELLGVPETASCKDDEDAVAQVEAAYDMLLMRSLKKRRAGKVVSSSIRFADASPSAPVASDRHPSGYKMA